MTKGFGGLEVKAARHLHLISISSRESSEQQSLSCHDGNRGRHSSLPAIAGLMNVGNAFLRTERVEIDSHSATSDRLSRVMSVSHKCVLLPSVHTSYSSRLSVCICHTAFIFSIVPLPVSTALETTIIAITCEGSCPDYRAFVELGSCPGAVWHSGD